MNLSVKKILGNFSHALFSNLVSLAISTFLILVVPKMLGMEEYGSLQLYFLYSSFSGMLLLGLNDGIYLKYGGVEYAELDKQIFFSQFWIATLSLILVVSGILVISSNQDNNFMLTSLAVASVLICMRWFLLSILQATNRLKEYSWVRLVEKILYGITVMMYLLLGGKSYEKIVLLDLLCKAITLFMAMLFCKELVFNKISKLTFCIREIKSNIRVGIKLMFANVANLLIVAIVRIGIESCWSVAVFGAISLTINISNMFLIFINTMGLVIYPILRKADSTKLPSFFIIIKNILVLVLFVIMFLYFPVSILLPIWLPEYTEGLKYMSLLFPMLIFEGKMSLLVSPYLKTLRQEKVLLVINIVVVSLSVVLTVISTLILENLNLAVLSITILLATRCTIAEVVVSKKLNINVFKDIILDLYLSCVFIFSTWTLEFCQAIFIYSLGFIVYVLIKRKKLFSSFKSVIAIIR